MARKKHKMEAKERKAREQAAAKRRRLVGRVAIVAAITLAALAIPLYALTRPGERVASQGRDHVPVGVSATFNYNSDPPTSGPHYDAAATPGVYDAPVPDGHLIHSLEHGYIIISHNTEGMDAGEADSLVNRLVEIGNDEEFWKLIVVPRPGMESRIALTAWQRIDRMDELDEQRVRRFIRAWRDRGPEDTPH